MRLVRVGSVAMCVFRILLIGKGDSKPGLGASRPPPPLFSVKADVQNPVHQISPASHRQMISTSLENIPSICQDSLFFYGEQCLNRFPTSSPKYSQIHGFWRSFYFLPLLLAELHDSDSVSSWERSSRCPALPDRDIFDFILGHVGRPQCAYAVILPLHKNTLPHLALNATQRARSYETEQFLLPL